MACASYGDNEEAAVNSALASTLVGEVAFAEHACADSDARRRRLLETSITVSVDVSVRDAAFGGASKAEIADSVQSTLAASVASGDLQELIALNAAQLDPSAPLLFVTSMSATAPPTMSPTPATEAAETLSPIGIALIVVGGVVLCGGVALYMCIVRRIRRARRNAAGPLGGFELSAVDAVPVAAVPGAMWDEGGSAGAWAAAATADPGPLGDFELSAVGAVPIAAVAVLDEEDSAGVWAAPATADPGSLSGVKTEMANGVPGVAL